MRSPSWIPAASEGPPGTTFTTVTVSRGIRRVGYSEQYRYADGIELLKKANVEVELVKIN